MGCHEHRDRPRARLVQQQRGKPKGLLLQPMATQQVMERSWSFWESLEVTFSFLPKLGGAQGQDNQRWPKLR